jgi:septal ring factor EnvC (AmiA/AmiB activator)
MAKLETKLEEDKTLLHRLNEELSQKEEQGKPTGGLKNRIASKQKSVHATYERKQKTKSKQREAVEKLKKQKEEQRTKDEEAVEKLKLQLEARELTRDYNLGTSLKSYVDPRVYLEWGRRVDYDWRSYYSDNLAKKFSWVDPQPDEEEVG